MPLLMLYGAALLAAIAVGCWLCLSERKRKPTQRERSALTLDAARIIKALRENDRDEH